MYWIQCFWILEIFSWHRITKLSIRQLSKYIYYKVRYVVLFTVFPTVSVISFNNENASLIPFLESVHNRERAVKCFLYKSSKDLILPTFLLAWSSIMSSLDKSTMKWRLSWASSRPLNKPYVYEKRKSFHCPSYYRIKLSRISLDNALQRVVPKNDVSHYYRRCC